MNERAAVAAAEAAVPAVSVRGLVARYGENVVLDGVSLDVRPGEIFVVMGGSGSGKTTLLRHMLGLLRPAAGAVRVLGVDVNAAAPATLQALRRRVGVAFQGGALLSSLSVGDNLALPLVEHTDLHPRTIAIMARMKLEAVELPGTERLMPSELSGGMLKRAALARAIVMDPDLLFCDEPSAGLDPAVSAAIDKLILRLREAMGMTVVVVTHELASAFAIADRICVLDGGEVVAVGTVDEIRHSANRRVQNLLNRRVETPTLDPDDYLRRLTGED